MKYLVVALMLVCGTAYAADKTISIAITEATADKALEGFLKLYPNSEKIPDPNWVDPKDGSKAPEIAKYSKDEDWVKEQMRRIFLRDVHRGLQIKAQEAAKVTVDDTMAK